MYLQKKGTDGKDGTGSGAIIEAFLRQIRSGAAIEESVFVHMYEQVQRWFNKFAFCRRGDDYLDLIDEAFTLFFARKEHFRGTSAGEFYNYMKTTVRNIIINSGRRGGGDGSIPEGHDPADPQENTARCIERNMELDALYACIEALEERQRVIVSEILAGTAKGDIARKLQISPGMLSQILAKAMPMMRSCLGKKGFTRELVFG